MPEPIDDHVRARMQRQERRDTRPEMALRRELHARGLRYRVDRSPMDGMRSRADLVFGPSTVAVFVDGCFWHRCPLHGSIPANNAEWWRAKLEANVARDRRVDRELRAAGWAVVRAWEHEDPTAVADEVETLVRNRRATRLAPSAAQAPEVSRRTD